MIRTLAPATSAETSGAELVLVPVGSIEQHGPHLPLHTDTVIAEAIARGSADVLDGAWVAPAVAYGASGEHQDFAGTSSIGTTVLHQVLVELVRSMRTWAGAVVFVNGHGGNVEPLASAVAQLTAEGHDVRWVAPAAAGGDAHAGRAETSLMLHLRPGEVRLERAAAGRREPMATLLPALRADGVAAVSPNGVLGDPAGATAEEGRELLERLVVRAVEQLRRD